MRKKVLMEEIELLDGASAEFDMDLVSRGKVTGIFWIGSTNFGGRDIFKDFLQMTTPPLPRNADIGQIDPFSEDFSAFVFKNTG